MKTGVEQQQYWLLKKTGMVMLTLIAPLHEISRPEMKDPLPGKWFQQLNIFACLS